MGLEDAALVHGAFPARLRVLLHGVVIIVARPRVVYHHVRVHVYSPALHQRNIMARKQYPRCLEDGVVALPFYLRNQRVREDFGDGRNTT